MKTNKDAVENAAKYLRMIWQGHDELNSRMFEEGAAGLYGILKPDVPSDSTMAAAQFLRAAYWLSDEAEEQQGQSEIEENLVYKNAGELIRKSRAAVGLETKSVEFTINWWKAYRHGDVTTLLENIVKEHVCQLNCVNNLPVAQHCTQLVMEAGEEHTKHDWNNCEAKLIKYFEIYLPAFLKKF